MRYVCLLMYYAVMLQRFNLPYHLRTVMKLFFISVVYRFVITVRTTVHKTSIAPLADNSVVFPREDAYFFPLQRQHRDKEDN